MYLESRLEENRTPLILGGIFAVSVALHLLLLLLALFFSKLFEYQPERPQPTRITIQRIQAPPAPIPAPAENKLKKMFVDTAESIPTAQAQTTPFEGETNTKASSVLPGQGHNALPNQVGINISGMTLRNQEASPEMESKSTPQNPTQEQTPPQEQAKPAEQTKEASTRDLPLNIPLRTNGTLSTLDRPKPSPDRKNQEASTAATFQTPTQTVPPATFSAQKRTNTLEGGAQIGVNPSIAAQESDMGRYKAKLYRAIGSRWYLYVKQDSAQVSIGVVKIRFKVSANGEISDLQTTDGYSHHALQAISRRSILELRGQLDPFPASMQEQIGDSYWEEVTFTIY
jgi:outer membrane biosynthesis protein TonB